MGIDTWIAFVFFTANSLDILDIIINNSQSIKAVIVSQQKLGGGGGGAQFPDHVNPDTPCPQRISNQINLST